MSQPSSKVNLLAGSAGPWCDAYYKGQTFLQEGLCTRLIQEMETQTILAAIFLLLAIIYQKWYDGYRVAEALSLESHDIINSCRYISNTDV